MDRCRMESASVSVQLNQLFNSSIEGMPVHIVMISQELDIEMEDRQTTWMWIASMTCRCVAK